MTTTTDRSAGDARGDPAIEQVVQSHRRELLVHCYRMLGGLEDAEDAVQETLLKAWRRLDTFEGRSSMRAWLYRIATNVCLDALDRRARRILPTAIAGPADPNTAPAHPAFPWRKYHSSLFRRRWDGLLRRCLRVAERSAEAGGCPTEARGGHELCGIPIAPAPVITCVPSRACGGAAWPAWRMACRRS